MIELAAIHQGSPPCFQTGLHRNTSARRNAHFKWIKSPPPHATAFGDKADFTCGMTAKEDKKTPARVGREPELILAQPWERPSLAGGVLCVDSAHPPRMLHFIFHDLLQAM